MVTKYQFNPWTYTQSHTPTVVQAGRVDGTLPLSFSYVAVFRNDFTWKAFDLLNKMRYILWVVALLEVCDATNNGRDLGRYLGFYQGLEIRLKPREMVIFCALHEK